MEEKLQQLSIGKALMIGAGAAFFYYLMMYDSGEALQNNITAAQAELQQKQADLQKMRADLAEAEQVSGEVKKLNEEMRMVKQAAPENYNSLELMKVLSSEAKVVGASIVSLTASSQQDQSLEKSEIFLPVTVTTELDGTFNQLMLFLSNLTKVSRLIIPKKLEFNLKNPSAALETASPTIGFRAEFQAYRYNPAGVQADAQ